MSKGGNFIEFKKPPIDHALPNTPIYDMIRFWGRKPHNLVNKYIDCYTEDNEIVFDPFAGCGVVATESLKLKRRVIYNDLNKFCRFIAKASSQPVKKEELEDAFSELVKNIQNKEYPVILNGEQNKISFDWLYSTKCAKCGSDSEIIGTVYTKTYKAIQDQSIKLVEDIDDVEIPSELTGEDKLTKIAIEAYKVIKKSGKISHNDLIKKNEFIKKLELGETRPEEVTRAINEKLEGKGFIKAIGEVPISIRYECKNNNCNVKKAIKEPDEHDLEKLKRINQMEPVYHYPKERLSYNKKSFFKQRPGTERVDKLFTKRNLIALSILKHEIGGLKVENEVKEALLLSFTAILEHVCKMERPNKKGWGVKTYWIAPIFLEQNPLHVFKNRFKAIIKGKTEINDEIGNFYNDSPNSKDVIDKKANVCFLNSDSRKLPIGDSSVDYIFTDPEYGDAIQYYELSFMASSWLDLNNNWKDEIVVNPKQGKTPEIYRDMLSEAFKEIYRVLKPNKYMTVTFHSREIKYWNALMYAIQIAGFRYLTAIYQIPQKEYTNWLVATDPGTMNGDVYITFYKPEMKYLSELKDVDISTVIQNMILPETRQIILLHNGQATFNQLVRGITLYLINKGVMHDPKIRDINYEKIFDEHFERLGRSKIWKIKEDQRPSPFNYIPLDRRIEWIIYSVFNEKCRKEKVKMRNIGVTASEFLSAIFTTLRNAKTPENREILDILGDIAEPIQKGGIPFWGFRSQIQTTLEYTPPRVKIPTIEPLEELDHVRVIKVISEFGDIFGFDIWIGEPEIRKNPELKKYRTVEELAIVGVDEIALNRLKNVDVIWLQRKTIPITLIEVENTTSPRDGLLRMGNVFEVMPHLDIKTFTILPNKKESNLKDIIQEPSIKRLIGERTIYYATYSLIAELMDEKEYRDLKFEDFVSICSPLEIIN